MWWGGSCCIAGSVGGWWCAGLGWLYIMYWSEVVWVYVEVAAGRARLKYDP